MLLLPADFRQSLVVHNLRLLFPSRCIRPLEVLCTWASAHRDCNLVEEVLSPIGSSNFTRELIPFGIIAAATTQTRITTATRHRSTTLTTYNQISFSRLRNLEAVNPTATTTIILLGIEKN